MRWINSPHQNERPPGMAVDMIVLHAISLPAGQFEMGYIEDLFMDRLDCSVHPSFADLQELKVSAHFVVDRKGGITQFVPCQRRAWHAGVSSWHEREGCNDFAIGIEMIGDETHPFTQPQYRETARLCRQLMQHFPAINRQRIVGHQDIAPGRKWDPGKQWSWSKFDRSLSRIRRLHLEVK
ncbi:1,6-anhydro-N-acetylmuramyl-L-alanine amidase AmpD [Mariprofundus sp. NF]|uniref:1,6-anhydro-N-acetylmuramyl-L-alanine amidase AmpD n=1 Tax=Mariprofundus sp. NF TaxID=2608716 RepID=UPI0015A298B2|nr:1,6-anhydro-N-acetylmuramyl-L-alanine amidase AmpD [Mariprofundus sp. NF]NWF37577.1 1,6-anhydro-N-acetylmuramyl-L-alanine amidase AmpD [Mariprofundus sp. NF]